jgi:hypothetical protein
MVIQMIKKSVNISISDTLKVSIAANHSCPGTFMSIMRQFRRFHGSSVVEERWHDASQPFDDRRSVMQPHFQRPVQSLPRTGRPSRSVRLVDSH